MQGAGKNVEWTRLLKRAGKRDKVLSRSSNVDLDGKRVLVIQRKLERPVEGLDLSRNSQEGIMRTTSQDERKQSSCAAPYMNSAHSVDLSRRADSDFTTDKLQVV
jgi:hypothetical protein